MSQVTSVNRSLTRMIVYTALRRNIHLDVLIDAFATGKISTPQVRLFLKVGLTQILFMSVPPHAAVFETVSAVSGRALPFKGMINAILRRATKEGQMRLARCKNILTTPSYLWKSWVATYGKGVARSIQAAHLTVPPMDISVKGSPQEWAKKLQGVVLPTGGVRIDNPKKITALDGYSEGMWWVQGFAAQIPVWLLGESLQGKTFIDMCAAPGGKTAQLLVRGAEVIAVDNDKYRLDILQKNMLRLGLARNLRIVLGDALHYHPRESVDGVLLDAPCSGTGSIRKHPDIPFLKRESDILSAAHLQRYLLRKGADMLRLGGILIFATCSIQFREGEWHLQHFPKTLRHYAISSDEMAGMEKFLTAGGYVRTLPSMFQTWGGIDGFFIARFKK